MNRYLVVTSTLTDPQWVVVSPVYAVDGAQCIIDDMGLTPGELIRVGGNEVNYIETVECTDPDSLDDFACLARKGQIAIRCSADTQIGDLERYLDVARYPFSKQHPGDPYHLCVKTGTLGDDSILLIANPALELQDPGDRLVGTWELDGTPVGAIDQDLYQQIRPLGNYETGAATRQLGYHSVAGDSQRIVGDPESTDPMARLYPGEPPFEVTFRRKYFENGEHSGEGWHVEVTAGTIRDASEYFIAIYHVPECTVEDFWFNTPYLSLGPSEWQFDDDGEPLQVYQTEYNMAGQGQPERAAIHHGLCKGSIHIQEGFETLELNEDEDVYLFWPYSQSGGEAWIDTGATVVAQAGQLYRISDVGVVDALTVGQKIKFTESGAETTFAGTWAGGADYVQIDPFVQASVGDALWSFE